MKFFFPWVLYLQSQSEIPKHLFFHSNKFHKKKRDTAGSIYHHQIADDLIQKLPNILRMTGGMSIFFLKKIAF